MVHDQCYTIDCSKKDAALYDRLRQELITNGHVKVKCENLVNDDCDQTCIDVIRSIGGVCCPYDDDPESLIWPVKVLELDTPQSKLQASQLDRELVLHTDCSYEHDAPHFVALYVVQCDRTEDGGKFQMVPINEVLDKLSSETKRLLCDETYKINVPPDFRKGDKDYISGPILLENGKYIRYRRDIMDKNQLKEESAEKQAAIAELNSIILAEGQLTLFRPKLENNMMVLFNNRSFLHGRTKILDHERYFLRVRFNLV